MRRWAPGPVTVELTSLQANGSGGPSVPPILLRAWLGRVQEALLLGVRLRAAVERQAATQLELLADELESVAREIRCALGISAKT